MTYMFVCLALGNWTCFVGESNMFYWGIMHDSLSNRTWFIRELNMLYTLLIHNYRQIQHLKSLKVFFNLCKYKKDNLFFNKKIFPFPPARVARNTLQHIHSSQSQPFNTYSLRFINCITNPPPPFLPQFPSQGI